MRALARKAPLLGPALLLLLLLLPGDGNSPTENPPYQVNGRLGGSVWFPLKFTPKNQMARIDWYFQTGSSKEILIAAFEDGKLQQKYTNNKFSERLEMADNTTLRIRALQREDSGALNARVLFPGGEVHKEKFLLSVFEPVPNPQIQHQLVSKTAEACHVTLQCLASANESFNISWEREKGLSIGGEDLSWYQLSAEGPDLSLLWRTNSSNSVFTCQLHNPIDQKNVSFDLLGICSSEGHHRTMWLLLPAVLISILAAGLVVYQWKKRQPQGVPEKEESPEHQYAGVQKKRSPPEGDENQDPDPCSPCLAGTPPEMIPVTIYDTVQPHPAT